MTQTQKDLALELGIRLEQQGFTLIRVNTMGNLYISKHQYIYKIYLKDGYVMVRNVQDKPGSLPLKSVNARAGNGNGKNLNPGILFKAYDNDSLFDLIIKKQK